jgi:hypothetical protein
VRRKVLFHQLQIKKHPDPPSPREPGTSLLSCVLRPARATLLFRYACTQVTIDASAQGTLAPKSLHQVFAANRWLVRGGYYLEKEGTTVTAIPDEL